MARLTIPLAMARMAKYITRRGRTRRTFSRQATSSTKALHPLNMKMEPTRRPTAALLMKMNSVL